PAAPILALTPDLGIARRLALAWGVHPLRFEEAADLSMMVADGVRAAREHGLAKPNDDVVVVAGFPTGLTGSTNLLHVARVSDVT
ncbi:pyruvate kinase alpha/beta domain-containing protein, partial [Massilia sp.]